MPGKPKYYLTTPIYYTNGLPHIGHTYSTIVCDTIRRYKRMLGYDVVMTTGTDEHGVNVERSAKKAGVPESEFVAKMAAEWRALWDELGVQGDEFIRTTAALQQASAATASRLTIAPEIFRRIERVRGRSIATAILNQ